MSRLKKDKLGFYSLLQIVFLFIFSLNTAVFLAAQNPLQTDSALHLNLQEAEKLFLSQNILLLTEQLNIDRADAEVMQAKVWPNPLFTLSEVQLSTAKETEPVPGLAGSNFWKNRNFGAELEQLILLAGKRKKNIALQAQNKETAQLAFLDFLSVLKMEFRRLLADLHYLQNVSKDLLFQKNFVDQLMLVQEKQFTEGIISKSQLFRIKSLNISIDAEIKELKSEISEIQKQLKTLMAIDTEQNIVVNMPDFAQDFLRWKNRSSHDLMKQALNHSSALQVAESVMKSSDLAWKLEKANAVPDLNLLLNYERAGNMHLNYVGAGISMELPFFNRNKGNIKKAALEIQQNQLLKDNTYLELKNAVVKTNADLQASIQLFESIDQGYLSDLESMTESLTANFLKKNISLLEFMDFFDAFKSSKERYYDVLRDFQYQKEELLYLIGEQD